MKWKRPVCVLMLVLFQLPGYGAESRKSSWTQLETQIGNKVLRLSVPGEATIKPYFSLEDPALYASNPGAIMFSRYWAYRGFRKEYGGVRCTIDIRQFRPGHGYALDTYEGLNDAVADAEKYSYDERIKRLSKKFGSGWRTAPFEQGVNREKFFVNNTIWAKYMTPTDQDVSEKTTSRYYVIALDEKRYLRVGLDLFENIEQEKSRDKWFSKAESLISGIANSLQLFPVPDKNASPSTPDKVTQSPEQGASTKENDQRTFRTGKGHQGTISGNLYTFPGNIFDCTVPSYSGETGWSDFVHETGGSVSFWNQFKLDRIDCVRFEQADQEAFTKGGPMDALYERFFKDVVLPSVYSGIPDAELQYSGMVPIGDQTIGVQQLYMAYMRLPHKGNSERMEEGKRIIGDAYRCWLVYAADGYFFSVSSQGQADLSKDRWIEEMTAAFQRCSFGRWWEK